MWLLIRTSFPDKGKYGWGGQVIIPVVKRRGGAAMYCIPDLWLFALILRYVD
jgi:hypothetical protein